MTIKFQTEKYPELELEVSVIPKVFGLNIDLYVDGELISPTDAKKHKYQISKNGVSYDIQITSTPYDSKVIINGKKFELTPKTEWYNYIIGGLPFVLMVSGGGLGAVFGFFGWYANMNFLRFEEGSKKYVYVLAVTLGIGLLFFLMVAIIQNLLA